MKALLALALFAAPLSVLADAGGMTEAQCRARIAPRERQAPEYYRAIYRKFVDDICTGEPAKNPRWQSCIVDAISSGRTRPHDVSTAWNRCHPEMVTCAADFARELGGRGNRRVREFVEKYCLRLADPPTAAEVGCAVRKVLSDDFYVRNMDVTFGLCVDQAQECVRDWETRGRFRHDYESARHVAALCKRTQLDHEYRGCILERFPAGSAFTADAIEVAREACAPEVRPQRACIYGYVDAGTFRNDHSSTTREIRSAASVCRIPAESGRACVIERYREGLEVPVAKYVCQHGSGPMRACLLDFLHGRGAYSAGGFEDDRRDLSFESSVRDKAGRDLRFETLGSALCQYSDETDRACVIREYLRYRNLFPPDRARRLSAEYCRERSEELRACARAFRAAIPVREINELAGGAVINPEKVCSIPTHEVRDCVLRRLIDVLNRRATYPEIHAACQAEFLDYTLGVLDGPEGSRYHGRTCPPARSG
jgi:hypothetical protein